MTTFHDLFRQPTRAVGGGFPPDHRRELFPGYVARSPRLHLWSPGDPIPERGERLLVGVATWSGYDLNLLDLIEEAPAGPIRVDVFDLDTCPDQHAIADRVPGIGEVVQPPVAGYWVDGRLVETAGGHRASQLVARVCGLDPTATEDRMRTVYTRT